MKYILNFRGKTQTEVQELLTNAAFPVIMGGGQKTEQTTEGVKIFIQATREELDAFIEEAESIEAAFDITFVPEPEEGSNSGGGAEESKDGESDDEDEGAGDGE